MKSHKVCSATYMLVQAYAGAQVCRVLDEHWPLLVSPPDFVAGPLSVRPVCDATTVNAAPVAMDVCRIPLH